MSADSLHPAFARALVLVCICATVTLAGCGATAPEATRLALPASVPDVAPGGEIEAARKAFAAGNFGYAARYFENAEKGAEACLGLAASYDWLYRFDLADPAYDRCARATGESFAYHNNRGFSYLLRGDTDRAAASFERARALRPGDAVIRTNLRILRDAVQG